MSVDRETRSWLASEFPLWAQSQSRLCRASSTCHDSENVDILVNMVYTTLVQMERWSALYGGMIAVDSVALSLSIL